MREAFAPDFVGPRHRLREDLLLRLFLSGDPGRVVLNAGAGQGTFTRTLEERGFEVTSVDLSADTLALLQARVAGAVVAASVEALPFADDEFDAVVLGEVLEHVDDALAVREVARVVRPGGVVAISVPANPAYFGPSDEWAGHRRRYTREALVGVVTAAGLRVERVSAWGFPLSTLYHRRVYEPRLVRRGAAPPGGAGRAAVRALGLALNVDRLFVGVERGALGYLLRARA